MGIFSRFRDIIGSNLNAMLDRAEDPEKLIQLMIREMEDTLVELKAACAGVMAARKKRQRQLEPLREKEAQWGQRAELAVDKGRDDLAREALEEKRRLARMAGALDRELAELGGIVGQYQDDIAQLEEKLTGAREKQRVLVQRHIRAERKKSAQEEIRRSESHQTVARFDELENRIERMEAEADLVNWGRKESLDEAFDKLLHDDDIERDLAALKSARTRRAEPSQPS